MPVFPGCQTFLRSHARHTCLRNSSFSRLPTRPNCQRWNVTFVTIKTSHLLWHSLSGFKRSFLQIGSARTFHTVLCLMFDEELYNLYQYTISFFRIVHFPCVITGVKYTVSVHASDFTHFPLGIIRPRTFTVTTV